MALGASAGNVVLMLLRQSLYPISIGVALGVIGGYGLSRGLSSMFFRLSRWPIPGSSPALPF